MISVSNELKPGEIVRMWYSLSPQKPQSGSKKSFGEVEMKVFDITEKYIRLESFSGYTVMFTDDILKTWFGEIKRV